MPKAYGYGRASTSKQGMTREVQEQRCLEYYQQRLAPKGVEWGGFYYDPATSGSTVFSEREQGRLLYFSLKKGDYLIVAELDRLFRNKRDGFVTLDDLDRIGVRRAVLDLPDLTGLEGDDELFDMLESSMVVHAHMYRRMLSRKMKRDNQFKRDNGIPYSRSAPIGWKIVGTRKDRAYRVDHRERQMVAFMSTLVADGMSHEDIANWNYTQTAFDCKRRFVTPARVRWALRAMDAGYPMITNITEFNRKLRSGEITLGTA